MKRLIAITQLVMDFYMIICMNLQLSLRKIKLQICCLIILSCKLTQSFFILRYISRYSRSVSIHPGPCNTFLEIHVYWIFICIGQKSLSGLSTNRFVAVFICTRKINFISGHGFCHFEIHNSDLPLIMESNLGLHRAWFQKVSMLEIRSSFVAGIFRINPCFSHGM